MCEVVKLAALLPMLCLERGTLAASGTGAKRRSISRRAKAYRSAVVYGTPAVALTICNLCLGHAVPRLGALLYQVVFQVASVLSTAALAWALLGQVRVRVRARAHPNFNPNPNPNPDPNS